MTPLNKRAAVLLACAALTVAACERRDEHSMTALMRAAATGDTITLAQLVRRGANMEARVKPHSGLKVFIAFISWMQELPDRNPGWTALMFAVDKDHMPAARMLIAAGADLNVHATNGMTLLDLVTLRVGVNAPMLRFLIEKGALLTGPTGYQPRPLIASAEIGDTSLIRLLLSKGAQVDAVDRSQQTPLMTASRAGHLAAVKLLLAAGADVSRRDGNGLSAYRWALQQNHHDIADVLQLAGASTGDLHNAALLDAIYRADQQAVVAALEQGADPNAPDQFGKRALLLAANKSGMSESIMLALMDAGGEVRGDDAGALMYSSIVQGFERVFDRLIAQGVAPRDDFLIEAARTNQVRMVARLLERGMDMSMQSSQPLRAASKYGAFDAAKFLIEKGADFNIEDRFGDSAFDEAYSRGRTDITRLMLEHGADPNRVSNGKPALVSATWTGNPDVVRLLLAKGADPAATDTAGQTALDHARRLRIERVIAVLEKAKK